VHINGVAYYCVAFQNVYFENFPPLYKNAKEMCVQIVS